MNREKQIVEALLEWHEENRRSFPWRDESDPYKVLVAEFFLQKTPAERVARIYPKFIKKHSSPENLAQADSVKLMREFASLGLKKRMMWIVESMKIICRKYAGRIPNTNEDLIALPGVGEYTASAVLCFGFGRDIPIVDVNIVRVLTRVFNLPKPKKFDNVIIKNTSQRLLPEGRGTTYNEALLDFAALICKKKPLCECCPLNFSCAHYCHEGVD